MLHGFVAINREEIIKRSRCKAAARSVSPPTAAEIDRRVVLALDGLLDALRGDQVTDLQRQALTVPHFVHTYHAIRQSITELAMEMNAPIDADDFPTVQLILNDTADAVVECERQRDQSRVVAADTGIDTRSTVSELHRGLVVLRCFIRSLTEVHLTH